MGANARIKYHNLETRTRREVEAKIQLGTHLEVRSMLREFMKLPSVWIELDSTSVVVDPFIYIALSQGKQTRGTIYNLLRWKQIRGEL
jgi:hypothetical protein